MTVPEPRPSVSSLPRYVPGARGTVGGAAPIKLSSNENPAIPLPSVVEAIAQAAGAVHRYPDMFCVDLTEAIESRNGLEPGQVVVGAGSVAVLGHALQAFCEAGDEVVYAWRSFEAYPILTRLAGARPVEVPLTDGERHDLVAMAAAVTPATKVVILCSPNNPTGPAILRDEFDRFMADVPSRVLVILDEAYGEFIRDPAAVHGLGAVGRYPHLIVARTFSKAYGLAGLRVGYAVGPESLIAPIRSCVTPFSVSGIAQAAALASLQVESELLARVDGIVAERLRVVAELKSQGWTIPDAQGNFVWIPVGARATELAAALAASEPSILVRPFAGEGVRITIGSPDENSVMLAALDSHRSTR